MPVVAGGVKLPVESAAVVGVRVSDDDSDTSGETILDAWTGVVVALGWLGLV